MSNSFFEKHVYDVDVIESIEKIHELAKNMQLTKTQKGLAIEEYFERIWGTVEFYCNFMKVDFVEKKNQKHLIVSSEQNFYLWALALELMHRSLHRIESFLNYQKENFIGNYYANKHEFVGMIEFLVCNTVESNMPYNDQLRLDRIMRWVTKQNEQKQNIQINIQINIQNNSTKHDHIQNNYYYTILKNEIYNILFPEIKEEKPDDSKHNEFQFLFDEKEFKEFLNEFRSFFWKDEWSLLKSVLINVTPKIKKKNVEDLSSSPNKIRKLHFLGYEKTFVELIKRIKYNKKIKSKTNNEIAEWIYSNFKYNFPKHSDSFKNFSLRKTIDILDKVSLESPRRNRILINLFPYIEASRRD